MKFKMTKEERNWVLYDVGNSAFVLLISTIMPIYFNYLAENASLSSIFSKPSDAALVIL